MGLFLEVLTPHAMLPHIHLHWFFVQALKIPKELFIKQPDGRIGIPSVLEYELEDGTKVPVPPTWKTHPDLEIDKQGRPRRSLPFKQVVYDREKYDFLLRTGWVYGPEHCGKYRQRPPVDNRRTS